MRPFGIPSTSHWTGAVTIVRWSLTKTCIVTRLRSSPERMPFSWPGDLRNDGGSDREDWNAELVRG